MNKTHWKNVMDYQYLGAYSLSAANVERIVLTIQNVKPEEVKGENGKVDVLPVVYFEESSVKGVLVKPMVFNKTNCKVMENLYSPFLEDWVGKRVEVYLTETKLKRDLVPCLRIEKKILPPIDYHCSICGKELENKAQYNAIIEKYGVLVCGKECVEKLKEKQNNEVKGDNE